MASASPSMAFEPSPAIGPNKENFTPLDEPGSQKPRLERGGSKVHFSPANSPERRAQSPATSVPFLDPVSSASQVPRQAARRKSPPPGASVHAYVDQSRALVESQRLNFEREREMFGSERKLWNAERAMLKSRIAALEQNLNKHSSRKRRNSNETPAAFQSLWKERGFQSYRSSRLSSSGSSHPSPVWDAPDVPVTRVFSNQDHPSIAKRPGLAANGLSRISETTFERPLSPRSVPVPVGMLDSSLDGITLKSAGLESSFIKVSPPRSTSPSQPPTPGGLIQIRGNMLQVNMDNLPSALDQKLVKNAGHTPMEFGRPISSIGTSSADLSHSSPHETSKAAMKEERSSSSATISKSGRPPLRPSERADSYFSNAFDDTDCEEDVESSSQKLDHKNKNNNGDKDVGPDPGDVELRGPLAMNNKPTIQGQADSFLDQLDARLHAEADRPRPSASNGRRSVKDTDRLDDDDGSARSSRDRGLEPDPDIDDGGPRLKLKKSMNFGSAFGSSKVGRL